MTYDSPCSVSELHPARSPVHPGPADLHGPSAGSHRAAPDSRNHHRRSRAASAHPAGKAWWVRRDGERPSASALGLLDSPWRESIGGTSWRSFSCGSVLGCCSPAWMCASDMFLGFLSPDGVVFGLSTSTSEKSVCGWARGSSMPCFCR